MVALCYLGNMAFLSKKAVEKNHRSISETEDLYTYNSSNCGLLVERDMENNDDIISVRLDGELDVDMDAITGNISENYDSDRSSCSSVINIDLESCEDLHEISSEIKELSNFAAGAFCIRKL